MDIDDALTKIRHIRAQTDPIPYYTHGGLRFINPKEIPNTVIEARRNRINSAPDDNPIQTATVNEVVQSLSESSVRDARFTQSATLVTVFLHAFNQYANKKGITVPSGIVSVDTICEADKEDLDKHSNSLPDGAENITHKSVEDAFHELAKGLAMQQHEVFVEVTYPELPEELQTVTKAFWRQETVACENQLSGGIGENSDEPCDEASGGQMLIGDF